jgi:hypothetical protein
LETLKVKNDAGKEETLTIVGRYRGAHGQAGALVVATAPDGAILFHDTARHLYGIVRDTGKTYPNGGPAAAVHDAYIVGYEYDWDGRASFLKAL